MDHSAAALQARTGAGATEFLAREVVVYRQVVIGARLPAHLDGNLIVLPGGEHVVGVARLPLVTAVAAGVERAVPMALGSVAGAGEAEHVLWAAAGAEEAGEPLVHRPTTLAVTPARH